MIDPECPDHSQFDVADCDTRREFHPDVEELQPSDDEKPQALGKQATLTVHKDSDHAHDVVTRRSVTGLLLLVNNTPVK